MKQVRISKKDTFPERIVKRNLIEAGINRCRDQKEAISLALKLGYKGSEYGTPMAAEIISKAFNLETTKAKKALGIKYGLINPEGR